MTCLVSLGPICFGKLRKCDQVLKHAFMPAGKVITRLWLAYSTLCVAVSSFISGNLWCHIIKINYSTKGSVDKCHYNSGRSIKFLEGPLTNTSNVQLHWQPSHWSCRVTGISLHIWVPECSCSDPSWGTWTWRRTFMVALSLLLFNTWWLDVDFNIKLISHSITYKFNYVWILFHLYIHMHSSHKSYNDLRVPLLFWRNIIVFFLKFFPFLP